MFKGIGLVALLVIAVVASQTSMFATYFEVMDFDPPVQIERAHGCTLAEIMRKHDAGYANAATKNTSLCSDDD